MTFLWLIVWLLKDTPSVEPTGDNSWFVAILVCVGMDILLAVK